MRNPSRAAAAAILFMAMAWTVGAQQTGEIWGRVTDERGEPLPGVGITVRSPYLQGLRTAVSDRNGGFRVPLLPVGTYALTFELAGFEKLTMTEQAVHLGLLSNLSVVLKPAAVREEITVVAPNPLIDATKADTSTRMTSQELECAPTQSRTIAEIVDLTPGTTGVRTNTVTGGANMDWIPGLTAETGLPGFRGEGNGANNWFVDGLSTKGAAYGDPGVRVNYDAWEEVQIVSDGFSPEMGQGVGGFINIVTKSGSNAFHGQFGGLFQGSGLRAGRKPQMGAATIPETSLGQYFGNLGGPIIKDKLWFFLSDNFFANSDVTREQIVDWLPILPGERNISSNNFFAKATLTPYEGHTLSLCGTLDKLLRQSGGIGVPETYVRTDYARYSYRLNYRGILSRNTLLTAAWGQNKNDASLQPFSDDFGPAAYSWQDIGQLTNNAYFSHESFEKRTDFAVGLVQYLGLGGLGNHEIRAGASYYRYGSRDSYHWTGLDMDLWPDAFNNGTGLAWAGPGHPLSLWESDVGEAKDTTDGFGFYADDNFVLGRFSFMAGLRTDTQKVFNDAGTKIWSWGVGDFLQPRATITWDLGGDGKTVVKLGYGLYSMPMETSSLPFINTRVLFSRRFHDWIGPADPTDAQLKDPLNWRERWAQIAPRKVDPLLKPNKSNRFLLEMDRQLGVNWVLNVRAVRANSHKLINPISIYDPGAPMQMARLLTNFEEKRRDCHALEAELNGRIPGRMLLNVSSTWSEAKGTVPGDFFEPFNWDIYAGGYYDGSIFGYDPLMPPEANPFFRRLYNGLFARAGGRGLGDQGWYGFLPYSVDHIVKLNAMYFAAYGINISTAVQYLSGYHWQKKGWSTAAGFYATFPEGRGVRTTPPHTYVDLAAEKGFRLRNGLVLTIGVNAYNLLNSQRPVSYFMNDNAKFGEVWARQLPRWVQLKVSLAF